MPYTVEIARPIYRRTECYGEGLGLDDAIKAAQQAAGEPSAESAEEVRGEPFVAAMRLDGKPVVVPRDYTEDLLLKLAAELKRLRQMLAKRRSANSRRCGSISYWPTRRGSAGSSSGTSRRRTSAASSSSAAGRPTAI